VTAAARRFVARLCAALLLPLTATVAFAHASLLDAQPTDGAMLADAPSQLRLRFNEPVAPLVLTLMLPDGSTRALDPQVTPANGLSASLPASAPRGSYLVSWRVVSADGHPLGGAVAYSVGAPSAPSALGAASGAPAATLLRPAIWGLRLLLYLALFVGVGGTLFRAFMPPARDSGGMPLAVLIAGFVALPCAVGLQGLDALAAPWSALASIPPWRAGLTTRHGIMAVLMLASLTAALVAALTSHAATRRAGAGGAALLAAAAFAASGHASTAPPPWLARPAVLVHTLAIVLWVGSLLPLRHALSEPRGGVVLNRFSRAIPWVLLALIVSGATLSILQLDLSQPIWSTDYGRILTAKLALVIAVLGVAAVNRFGLTRRVGQGDAVARRRMGRLIVVEMLLVLGIFALAATWRFTPPPRALSAARPHPVSIHLHGDKAMIDLSLRPQGANRWDARLSVLSADSSALAAREVALELSRPGAGIEALQKFAVLQPDGVWLIEPFALPAVGRWHVRVRVLISDFEQTALEADGDIGP